jgi:hypothetical protein
MRGWVCHIQMLLALASALILGSESRGTLDHMLLSQIRDFPFVASYDSQGYGGGIRHRHHTGNPRQIHYSYLNIWDQARLKGDNRKIWIFNYF